MFTALGLLTAPALLSAAPQQELTLQQVLKANTAAIQAIRSLHVTIDVSNNFSMPGEEPPPEAQPTYSIEWYKDGERERVRQNWLRGRRPNNLDAYNGLKGFKALRNYDPDFKPPLSESISHPATGEIDKMQTEPFSGSARVMSYMILVGGVDLEAYIAKYPSSKLAATPATSKLGCYEIETFQEMLAATGMREDICDLRIFVDPKVGFWIRRIERSPWQKTTDPNKKTTTITAVQEFKDCGNGIYWPQRSYTRSRLPGGTSGPDVFVHHSVHSINQPLPEKDFEIHFPDWLRVLDSSSGKVIIWGPDNKPRMEFASLADYNKWYQPRMQDPFRSMAGLSPQTRWAWLTGLSLFVGLLLSFVLWRRRNATRRLKKVSGNPEITSIPSEPEGR